MSKRPYRVALNGYGRIGRCVFRALHERGAKADFSIVALNDLADLASLEYLTRFDSTHGRFPGEVSVADGGGPRVASVVRAALAGRTGLPVFVHHGGTMPDLPVAANVHRVRTLTGALHEVLAAV